MTDGPTCDRQRSQHSLLFVIKTIDAAADEIGERCRKLVTSGRPRNEKFLSKVRIPMSTSRQLIDLGIAGRLPEHGD